MLVSKQILRAHVVGSQVRVPIHISSQVRVSFTSPKPTKPVTVPPDANNDSPPLTAEQIRRINRLYEIASALKTTPSNIPYAAFISATVHFYKEYGSIPKKQVLIHILLPLAQKFALARQICGIAAEHNVQPLNGLHPKKSGLYHANFVPTKADLFRDFSWLQPTGIADLPKLLVLLQSVENNAPKKGIVSSLHEGEDQVHSFLSQCLLMVGTSRIMNPNITGSSWIDCNHPELEDPESLEAFLIKYQDLFKELQDCSKLRLTYSHVEGFIKGHRHNHELCESYPHNTKIINNPEQKKIFAEFPIMLLSDASLIKEIKQINGTVLLEDSKDVFTLLGIITKDLPISEQQHVAQMFLTQGILPNQLKEQLQYTASYLQGVIEVGTSDTISPFLILKLLDELDLTPQTYGSPNCPDRMAPNITGSTCNFEKNIIMHFCEVVGLRSSLSQADKEMAERITRAVSDGRSRARTRNIRSEPTSPKATDPLDKEKLGEKEASKLRRVPATVLYNMLEDPSKPSQIDEQALIKYMKEIDGQLKFTHPKLRATVQEVLQKNIQRLLIDQKSNKLHQMIQKLREEYYGEAAKELDPKQSIGIELNNPKNPLPKIVMLHNGHAYPRQP